MAYSWRFLILLSLFTRTLIGQESTVPLPDLSADQIVTLSLEEAFPQATLDLLDQELAGKRFVSIGEFTHGSREVFLLRNCLIKFLHERHGFDVILFEAGIGELITPDAERQNLTSRQMTGGLFGPWRTEAFRTLMDYLRAQDIDMAGFDVQRTAQTFGPFLVDLFLSAELDTTNISSLERTFGSLRRSLPNRKIPYSDSLHKVCHQLINAYEAAHQDLLQAGSSRPLGHSMMALRTIENRVAYLQYMIQFKQDQDWNRRWASRDSMMAKNVEWLAEHLYRGRKIILVGHNFHLAKHNPHEAVMGEFLQAVYPEETYILGTFAGSGTYLDNYGREVNLQEAAEDALDIKHIIRSLEGDFNFLKLPDSTAEPSHWSQEPITINDTFISLNGANQVRPGQCFDALLLVKESTVPKQ